MTDLSEKSLEAAIERKLVGSTREERLAINDLNATRQAPVGDHFYWGDPSDMDKVTAIDTLRLWSFLEATQKEELEKYPGANVKRDVLKRISDSIAQFGVLRVLREGVKCNNIKLRLFYAKPSRGDSAAAQALFKANQFSLTRQQTFSIENPGLEIDLVLFVNGIPLFTFELKNEFTHQTARVDGQKQLRSLQRHPKNALLSFGRCLAHFTLDTEEVFFTTRLALEKTNFMPFNKGIQDGRGAGNPVNPNGFKTAYLWDEVLTKENISDIVMNYALFKYDDSLASGAQVLKKAKGLVFPRYHQFDVVTKLIAAVETTGVGGRYLIEHSAGSGKSNSITWLAYKLLGAYPRMMEANRAKALDVCLFDSVIVVTDARILDRQISANITAFGHDKAIVEHADSSDGLRRAIEGGKRIIITTIQKFPFICDAIADVSGKNFAVVIDEAHSSQSGIAAGMLNASLQHKEGAAEDDLDDLILKLADSHRMSPNATYFAFTATPKKETLEKFGTRQNDGSFRPFHLYSMRQAIEEGFILDVLSNYTTFKSYYELHKSVEANPRFSEEKARKILHRLAVENVKAIADKAEVILDHFDGKVFKAKKLNGKAKAIVATEDIARAISYYNALQEIAKERQLPYHILIAFSGEKEIDGNTYTEASMNGFPESQTAAKFDEDENRILVVADKFLTGFDQPKLCALYLDKSLKGVKAVQALSRLNRAAPELGKRSEDLFILDFFNTVESIRDSFAPFYTGTILTEETNVNVLHDLQFAIDGSGIYTQNDVEEFAKLYFTGAPYEELMPIIDGVITCYMDLEEDARVDLKVKTHQFVKVYSKVAAILAFDEVEWEKRFWFYRLLLEKMVVPGPKSEDMKELVASVDLTTHGLRRTALNVKIELDPKDGELEPNKPVMAHGSADLAEESKSPLDELLDEFNERWFKGWGAAPEDQKIKVFQVARHVVENESYELTRDNPDRQAATDVLRELIDDSVLTTQSTDLAFYKSYKDQAFKEAFQEMLIKILTLKEKGALVEEKRLFADVGRLGCCAEESLSGKATLPGGLLHLGC